MAKAMDCKYVFIDHVSIIVSAQSNGDERKAIDEIMTKLRTLVQETGISLFVVSHLKRPESKGHEEGATTSLAQLRGSASIAQLSDIVIGLERNAQADDPTERNTTRVRVLKNRFSGETGKACSLLYSMETGRMTEYDENAL
jgi:twinkle protein